MESAHAPVGGECDTHGADWTICYAAASPAADRRFRTQSRPAARASWAGVTSPPGPVQFPTGRRGDWSGTVDEWLFRFRWVVPDRGDPIPDGGVLLCRDQIVAVEPFRRLAGKCGVLDFGDAVALPPLVNAHTHWEFSDLGTPIVVDRQPTDWLHAVIRHRRNTHCPRHELLARGIRETLAAGTSAVGEIATCELSHYAAAAAAAHMPHTIAAKLQCLVFRELIGLRDDSVKAAIRTAQRHVSGGEHGNGGRSTDPTSAGSAETTTRSVRAEATTVKSPGIDFMLALSPHAPYSVRDDLLAACVDLARRAGVPLAMHFAEFSAERELLARGTGPLREFLERLGVCDATSFATPRTHLELLEQLADAPRVLLIHGNHLTEVELQFIRGREQFSLVYCPRTHAHFGHPTHPWPRAAALGVNVALGTDSRASNPDLSLLNELRFLLGSSRLPLTALLPLASRNGCRALGLPCTGGLCPGAAPQATILAVRQGPKTERLDRWLLQSRSERCWAVNDPIDWIAAHETAQKWRTTNRSKTPE
ncbi:MAG: hypothetical protein D6725_05650 [Planctomycetota bacterium]|nr:MAG: hypothetical protein D6725_05650 [Planctomycetota bacterium]